MGTQRGDPVRRLRRLSERCAGQIADVSVAIELNPRPAVAFVVDHHALAVERLGFERRLCVGQRLSGALARDDPRRAPFDVARRFDLAEQMRGGKVGARGGEAGIECGNHRLRRPHP